MLVAITIDVRVVSRHTFGVHTFMFIFSECVDLKDVSLMFGKLLSDDIMLDFMKATILCPNIMSARLPCFGFNGSLY